MRRPRSVRQVEDDPVALVSVSGNERLGSTSCCVEKRSMIKRRCNCLAIFTNTSRSLLSSSVSLVSTTDASYTLVFVSRLTFSCLIPLSRGDDEYLKCQSRPRGQPTLWLRHQNGELKGISVNSSLVSECEEINQLEWFINEQLRSSDRFMHTLLTVRFVRLRYRYCMTHVCVDR